MTVQAKHLARDVTLLVDKIDPEAVADDALVTLLPGESATFTITGAVGAEPAQFADPRVCARRTIS
ncbi:hypothetical protein ABCS02_19465 [Microbacterium sp. X-17]|uniref:hypothetical protein n=1 Tax=Microbacterium sp. X-17 TaxID=3144404 RepID=UPI0031F5B4AA